jgi:methylphosphotriester-DNA--protein-cysteine methyltransferase
MTYKPTPNDRNTVRVMVAAGVPQEDIAKAIGPKGIDPKTLRRHFRRELDMSMIEVRAKIGTSLIQQCLQGNVAAIKWLESTRYGLSDKTEIVHEAGDALSEVLASIAANGKRIGQD